MINNWLDVDFQYLNSTEMIDINFKYFKINLNDL